MKRLWLSLAALAAVACVSFDPAGPPVRDISGSYAATIVTRVVNTFETLSDTFSATLDIRNTGDRGKFAGDYRISSADAGPFGGTLRTSDSLTVFVFGGPPKPIAGVATIRDRYPWCDFTTLGIGPMPGAFRNDSLIVDGHGSVFCFYGVGGGFLLRVYTDIFLSIRAT